MARGGRRGSKGFGSGRACEGTWSRSGPPSGSAPSGWGPTTRIGRRREPTMQASTTLTRRRSTTSRIWQGRSHRCPSSSASTKPMTPRRSRRSCRRRPGWPPRRSIACRPPSHPPRRQLPSSPRGPRRPPATSPSSHGSRPWSSPWMKNSWGTGSIGRGLTNSLACSRTSSAFHRVATSHRQPQGG